MTHYLDHAATSPILDCAREAWIEAQNALAREPGNPAALHAGGRRAKRMLEDARERIGLCLGAERAEVVLVSGATESDALAVVGAARALRALAPERNRVLLSEVEHDAVGEQAQILGDEGFEVAHLKVASCGVVELDSAKLAAEADSVALASLTLVSSEIGTIQPVHELVEALKRPASAAHTTAAHTAAGLSPLVHTDAAQAVGLLDVDFAELGVDLLSIGGHKIGAPVGTGVLLVKRGTPLRTDRPGGGHERGLRSGTPDVAGACALAAALEETLRERPRRREHAYALRTLLLEGVSALSEDLGLPIHPSVDPHDASPAIIHLSIPTSHPEAVLMAMDAAGVALSAGSACHAGVTRPSAIRLAMGASEAEALGVLRVSTGPSTLPEDIEAFLRALPQALAAGRALDAREASRVAYSFSRRS